MSSISEWPSSGAVNHRCIGTWTDALVVPTIPLAPYCRQACEVASSSGPRLDCSVVRFGFIRSWSAEDNCYMALKWTLFWPWPLSIGLTAGCYTFLEERDRELDIFRLGTSTRGWSIHAYDELLAMHCLLQCRGRCACWPSFWGVWWALYYCLPIPWRPPSGPQIASRGKLHFSWHWWNCNMKKRSPAGPGSAVFLLPS